jgi:peptidyl-prolyl cis-trans isomerase A (cyclophilin A)
MRMLSSSLLVCLPLVVASSGCDTRSLAQSGAPVVVVFQTEKGAIEIEVDAARAPVTSANFLKYVDAGLYDGGVFYRTVRPDTESRPDVPIQVIQARMNVERRREGFPRIPIERTSTTGLRHVDGAVSMARAAADTATNEFFICIGDQPLLDFGGKRNDDGQGFAAFGRVIAGMEVVKAIHVSPVAASRPPGARGRASAAAATPASSQSLRPPIRILKASRRR